MSDIDPIVPFSAQDYPRELCIHQLFEQQAIRTPEALALVDGAQTYTYAALNARANRLARLLRRQGVRPEVIVGCYLSRSSAIVVHMLAVLKAGGAYLLLDPHLPAQRLQYLIENAGPALILADAPLPQAAPAVAPLVLLVADAERAAQRLSPRNVHGAVRPHNAAYLAYTSGSTGRPKGVVITHQATVNHSCAFMRLFKLVPADRVPLMAPIAFDMATEEILPPLMAGCTLIVSASHHTSMPDFTQEIIANRYTILNLPAPLWHLWTAYLRDSRLAVPPHVRLVIVGSDKIHTRRFQEWQALPGSAQVAWAAAYGTTETTVTSSFYMSAWEDDLRDEPAIPIGKPIANTQLYILDEQERPVPAGAVGELYIGGQGLARGYHRLDDITRERFVPDPFSPEPGACMYKTGDLARQRPDGNVVCLGRKDLQVKINGLRIELGEIEAVLSEHPLVSEAAVVLQQTGEEESAKQLIAFVTLRSPGAADTGVLRAWAAQRLHRHMVPASIVHLPRLPLTGSGKLDRKALEGYTAERQTSESQGSAL